MRSGEGWGGRPTSSCSMIHGSVATDALDSFARGDLPGITTVLIDGEPRVVGRSQQTPPPARTAVIVGSAAS